MCTLCPLFRKLPGDIVKRAYNFAMQLGHLSGLGEFTHREFEAMYREEHLPEFIRHIWLVFCGAAVISPLFLFSDWRFYGHTHFYFAISARAAIEIASLVGLAAVTRIKSFPHLEFVCIAWACFVIPASTILVSPHTDIALLVTFILPVLFYLVFPLPFLWISVFGVGCSAAALGAYLSSRPLSETSLGMIAGMLMLNTVLALVLIQSNRLRRLEWAATRAERQANKELSEHRDMLQKIFKATPAPLLITARHSGLLIQANAAACDYFGAGHLKDSFQIEKYMNHNDWTRLGLKLRSEGQAAGFEARILLSDGSVRNVLLAATEMEVAGTKALLTMFVDITHRKEVEVKMERLANTDPLSGLPNRARFFAVAVEEIKRAARYNRPLAVLMVDIDLFKRVNDTHGHDVGDAALKAFAGLCRIWVRSQDLVARLGGEEFGVLLPETDATTALALADRLRATVANQQMEGLQAPITISVGISEVQPWEVTVDAALARADEALYVAKRSGRNRAVLYDCVISMPAASVQ